MPSKPLLNNEKLFKRLSQILGVPVRYLKPIEQFEDPTFNLGEYNRKTHSYKIQHHDSTPQNEAVISHEETHGIQALLSWRRLDRWQEELERPHWREPTNPFFSAYPSADIFKKLYLKHGVDFALLAWINPPIGKEGTHKGIASAKLLPEWEQKMVKNGLLHSAGGLTPKGLQHFRKKTQPMLIWLKLARAKAEREKEGLKRFARYQKPAIRRSKPLRV